MILINKQFCLSSNLSHYFGLYNTEIEPCTIFGLAGCIGTTCNTKPEFIFERVNGRNGMYRDMIKRLSENSGLLFLPFEADIANTEEFKQLLPHMPVLLEADDYYLDYSPFYSKHHYGRLVVFIGAEEGKAVIFDEAERRLSLDSFSKAVGIKAKCFMVNLDQIDISEQRIMQSIRDTCQSCLDSRNEMGVLTGYEALQNLLKETADDLLKLSREDYHSLMYQFYFQLNRPGGFSNTRYLFGQYLDWAGKSLQSDALLSFAEKFKELADAWETGGNIFFRGKIIYKPEYFKDIYHYIISVITDEKKEFEEIYDWVTGGVCNESSIASF